MGIVEVITVFAIIATNLGTVIALHMHQDTKTTAFLTAIQQEMKEFHGRMERQDAEFRARAEKIDIESKARTEKLDAEFKSHIMYCHSDKKNQGTI